MDRELLFREIVASRPGTEDVVYIERRGDEYAWALTGPDEAWPVRVEEGFPDVWIYWSGWPAGDPARHRVVFEDLLGEMESMAGGSDRCRWPLDEPWPHRH
jgi:hypothetical protein